MDLASRYPECSQKCYFQVTDSKLDQQRLQRMLIMFFCLLDTGTTNLPHFLLELVLSVSEPNCFWSSTSSLKLKYSYSVFFEKGNRFQKLELQIHGTQPRVKKDFNLFPKPKPKPPHGGAQSLCFAGKQSQNCFTINIKSFIFKYQ